MCSWLKLSFFKLLNLGFCCHTHLVSEYSNVCYIPLIIHTFYIGGLLYPFHNLPLTITLLAFISIKIAWLSGHELT